MTGWIVAWSMKFRLLVVAVAALTLIVGVSELRSMPVDVLPEYAPVTVEVQTEALGLSSAEVEQLITVPIEQDLLNGIAFLKDIRSQSVPGLSRIFLVFDPGTDLFTRTAGRGRAHDTGPRAAERLEAAADPAAALVDESRPDGRRQLEEAVADPDVGARALDDHPAPARRPRRGQRLDLGRARQAAAGAGRPAEAE